MLMFRRNISIRDKMFCENNAHHMVVFIKYNQRNDNQKSVTRTEFIPARYMIYVVGSNDDFFQSE
jgi:hypothetical protein